MQNIPENQEKKPLDNSRQEVLESNRFTSNVIQENKQLSKQAKDENTTNIGLKDDANRVQENIQINQPQYPNYQQGQQYQQYYQPYQPYQQFQQQQQYYQYHQLQQPPWNSQAYIGHHGNRGHWGGHHGYHGHHGHHGNHGFNGNRGYRGKFYNNNHGSYENEQQQSYQNPNPPFVNYVFPPHPPPLPFPHPKDLPYTQNFPNHPPFHPPPPNSYNFPAMNNSHYQSSQSSKYNKKEQCYKYKKHEHKEKHWRKKSHKKHSRSKSRGDSSSSSSSNEESKRVNKQFKGQDEQIQKHYKKQMNDFLQSRQINEMQRQKIVRVLSNRFPLKDAQTGKIIQYLQFMEKENLVFRMSYVKLIKIIIKFQFELSEIIPKIQKIQRQKIKKFEADQQYNQTYGQKEQTPLLDVNDLILSHSNNSNVIFLVDGNNILPTNKHFRRYFQSKHTIQKVIAQIKCRWYFSHAFNPQEISLFFDQKYEEQDYKYAREQLRMEPQQQVLCNSINVIYGDGVKADNKIIEKLQQLSTTNEKYQIILISADRDLIMRCQQIKPILHTSGKFFFKYAKYKINRKYKGNKTMKSLAKQIMFYSQFY